MKRITTRRLWLFVAAGAVITVLMGIYADVDRLATAMARFDWVLVPIVVGLTVANQSLRFVKWEYLLGEVAVDIDRWTSFHVFGSGLLMIVTPGKMGEIWKSWLIGEREDARVHDTVGVVVVERITDVVAVGLLSAAGLFVYQDALWGFGLLLAFLAVGSLVFHDAAVERVIDLCDRWRVLPIEGDDIRPVYEDTRTLLVERVFLVTVLLSVVSWSLECLGMWLVLSGFGFPTSPFAAAFVFATASILGAVSLLPGGIGVTETSMVGLLLVIGATRETAVGATMIVRATTLWFVAIAALLIYLNFRRTELFTVASSD